MNKKLLVKKLIAHLTEELSLYTRAARAAHAEATDEQSKAENKYDTRGLEASYLARGQSRQLAEIARAIAEYEALVIRDFSSTEPIDVGALVELQTAGERSLYFVGPSAGGTEITEGKREILVITPQSPLGKQLVGKKQGDRGQMQLAGAPQEFHVITVR